MLPLWIVLPVLVGWLVGTLVVYAGVIRDCEGMPPSVAVGLSLAWPLILVDLTVTKGRILQRLGAWYQHRTLVRALRPFTATDEEAEAVAVKVGRLIPPGQAGEPPVKGDPPVPGV